MNFSIIKELESKHAIKLNLKQNICLCRGTAATVFDLADKSYLDLAGGSENCLGYGDGYLTAAITYQAQRLASAPCDYYSENYGTALSKLLNNTGFSKACLTSGGSEANLTALAIIREYLKENGDERQRIVITTTKNTEAGAAKNEVGLAGTSGGYRRAFVRLNDFAALKKALTPSTAAFVIQPIFENGGVIMADYDYLVNAYALCKSRGILLFCDETRIGIARTGKKFAFEHYGIQPDIVTLSRGLAGGLPIGAILLRDTMTAGIKPVRHNSDEFDIFNAFGDGFREANALSSAAANVVLDRLDNGLLTEIEEKGEYLFSRLYKLSKYNFVLDVRGRGLLAGVALSGRIMAAKVANQMEKLGYLVDYTDGNVLLFSPPFIITKAEIDDAISVLSELFASTNI